MKLTIVGCSGSYPGPDSSASCYLVEAHDGERPWRILLDLGNGSLGSLQRHLDPLVVDAVFLSHLHPDHCMDLCGFYVLRKYHPRGVGPCIPVFGPAGAADRLARGYDLPLEPGMTKEFCFTDFGPEAIQIGPFEVRATRVAHPVAAFALTVSAMGKTLTYSGDTAACDALVEAAADADLFLCEASFLDGQANPPGIHLTGSEAGEAATRAGAKRLLITHVPPWHDREEVLAQARTTYAGAELADPGATYSL